MKIDVDLLVSDLIVMESKFGGPPREGMFLINLNNTIADKGTDQNRNGKYF